MGSHDQEVEGFRVLLGSLGNMPGLAEVLEESDERDQSPEVQKFVLERFARYRGTSGSEDRVKEKRKKKTSEKVEGREQSTWQKSNPYAALG